MNELSKVIGAVFLAGVVMLIPARSGAQDLGAMRVRLVEGDVQLKIAETGDWAPVAPNTPIFEGDELWVPDGSRAALQTSNGSHVRLGEKTAFEVLRMDRDSFQFHLRQGRAYVLNRAPKGSVLQIDTPEASVRAFNKARFRVDVPDGETDISVFKGSVLAESDAGTTKVRRDDMLVLAPDGYAELSPLPEPDDFDLWNGEQDRIVLARGRDTRYLPDELQVYSDDFDENGRWVYVQDYGYCWTPTVVVVNDWAPYRYGRWCWRGGDYVWVGYEPWGWAPYHYGRWAFVARVGWCWVPPERGNVYWGPGYVGWVRTPEHVAWVPLAPRETYYGRGNYGRYSVNVTNVNIATIRVTNVYRNVNVTNSITVVNQATFVTGRPGTVDRNAAANVREDFARRRNIVVGRPPIAPSQTSYAPVVRSIPEAKRPPAAIRKIDVKELRQSRPLVRDTGRSAIRPAERTRPLTVRKVETPRTVKERAIERRDGRPAERRGPGAPQQGGPQGQMERGRDAERGRRDAAPVAPAERMERRGGPQPAPTPNKVMPEAAPGGPGGSRGRGRTPAEAAPQDKGKPERGVERSRPPETPPQRIRPEAAPATPSGNVDRGRRNAAPATPPAQPERGVERSRPPETPPQRIRPEAAPATPSGNVDRGRRNAAPAAPPAQPEPGVERNRRQETPAEKSRPSKPDDNTDRPAIAPEERSPRGRR